MKNQWFGILLVLILLSTACSEKNDSFIVKFEGNYPEKKWPLKELNDELPADWSGSGFLTFEMNSSTTQRFELRVYDKSGIRIHQIGWSN
jgi:hypothetical protein